MIEAKFTVALGDYQNVKLTIKGSTHSEFQLNLSEFSNAMQVSLGEFQAELESWARGMYEKLARHDTDAAAELLKSALGATELEVIDRKLEPEPDDASPRAWNQKPATVKPAPWTAQAKTTTTDNGDDW